MLNEHYFELLNRAAALMTELGNHPDEAFAEKVVELLRQIDLVHREGLLRLVDGLRAHGADDTIERIVADDAVVRVLLGLYGLADLELPAESEPETADVEETVGFFPVERLRVHRADATAAAREQ